MSLLTFSAALTSITANCTISGRQKTVSFDMTTMPKLRTDLGKIWSSGDKEIIDTLYEWFAVQIKANCKTDEERAQVDQEMSLFRTVDLSRTGLCAEKMDTKTKPITDDETLTKALTENGDTSKVPQSSAKPKTEEKEDKNHDSAEKPVPRGGFKRNGQPRDWRVPRTGGHKKLAKLA